MRRDGVLMLDALARFANCETGSTTCIVSAVGENVLLAGRAEIHPGFRLSRFRGNVTMFFVSAGSSDLTANYTYRHLLQHATSSCKRT